MVNKIVCNSVKCIGHNVFDDTVLLNWPMAFTHSDANRRKFSGIISISTGVKYALIVVKLNKNISSKFIDCELYSTPHTSIGLIELFSFRTITIIVFIFRRFLL